MLYTIVTIYLILINLVGLFAMWSDKRKAKKGAWRIKESTLFAVALLGGALGTTLGMYWFRHKTQHWSFKLGMPAILAVQIILALGLTWWVAFGG